MKTEFVEVLTLISKKLYDSAAEVMRTASQMIPANTFCIANLNPISTTVLSAYNRDAIILTEGLVMANEESYCALVTEKTAGPLIIDNNMTHPLTKDMAATQFVGGCSFLGVPIYTGEGQMYGSLCAFDDTYYQFEQKDVDLLLALSSFYSTFLEMEEAFLQLQRAEEKTLKILEEKSNLLAVVSHEIRTPMNGIMGMASLLQSTPLTTEQSTYLEVIETCSISLLSILNQILDYSKMESGKMELESYPFDMHVCIEQVLKLFHTPAEEKGIALTVSIAPEITGIFVGDSNKIRQILLNLIGNAIKFTEEGEIAITVKLNAAVTAEEKVVQVYFSVKDTGVGIPEEGKSRLFQSFSQLHDPVSTQHSGGVGLGLSICKQLTELMNGRIWLEESNDNGTCFAFTIPLMVRDPNGELT